MGTIKVVSIFGVLLLILHAVTLHAESLLCPEVVQLNQDDLTRIVARERLRRNDVPPVYDNFRVEVSRTRCLYEFVETKMPDDRFAQQWFVISPFGELVDFMRINESGEREYKSQGTVIGRGEVSREP